MFVIKMKSDKWHLLQDLRKVNVTMISMGSLQSGVSSFIAIHKGHYKIVVDLKDCLFTIP